MSAIQDVSFSYFELALAHHLLLDGVLHVFDVDESLSAYVKSVGDSAGDLDSWLGIKVEREKGFTHSDLDLGLTPRYDLAITADEADGDWLALGSWCRFFAAKHKAARDIVRVVFDERLFDKKVDVVSGEFEGTTLLDLLSEHGSNALSDTGDELAVYFSENLFLLTREEQVGKGVTNGVGNLSEVEIALGAFRLNGNFRATEAVLP